MKSLSDIVDSTHKNEATGLTKAQIDLAAKALINQISNALREGEDVRINNFGGFSVATRGERMGRNPATGETKLLAASKNVKFKASASLKSLVA